MQTKKPQRVSEAFSFLFQEALQNSQCFLSPNWQARICGASRLQTKCSRFIPTSRCHSCPDALKERETEMCVLKIKKGFEKKNGL
jgi:hypothetical protein